MCWGGMPRRRRRGGGGRRRSRRRGRGGPRPSPIARRTCPDPSRARSGFDPSRASASSCPSHRSAGPRRGWAQERPRRTAAGDRVSVAVQQCLLRCNSVCCGAIVCSLLGVSCVRIAVQQCVYCGATVRLLPCNSASIAVLVRLFAEHQSIEERVLRCIGVSIARCNGVDSGAILCLLRCNIVSFAMQ